MTVTLISNVPRMQVFNLDHPTFRSKEWGFERKAMTVIEETRDGQHLPKQIRKSICGSLTLRARERREGLPPQIVNVPEVKRARELGYVLVETTTPPAATPTAVPEPKSEPAAKKRRGKES